MGNKNILCKLNGILTSTTGGYCLMFYSLAFLRATVRRYLTSLVWLASKSTEKAASVVQLVRTSSIMRVVMSSSPE